MSDVQQFELPTREAEPGASISDDNRFSRNETARLQDVSQRLIEDRRVLVIGSEP
jgi:hypothetical protein